MKYLGVDYGEKRVGLALSDEDGRIAFPYAVIQNKGKMRILREIRQIILRENIAYIVVGVPRALSGADTAETKIVLRFIQETKKRFSLSVAEENEVLTTRIAQAHSTKHIDASAAALILQSYLDRQNKLSM